MACLRPDLVRVVALLALVPFVMLSLIAQGTMVVRGPAPQSFMMVLCGADAPVAMVMDNQGNVALFDDHDEGSEPVPHQPKQPCEWAMAHGQPVIGLDGPATPHHLPPARPAFLSSDIDNRTLLAEVLTPVARGPPTA